MPDADTYVLHFRPHRKAAWVRVTEGSIRHCVAAIDGRGARSTEWWLQCVSQDVSSLFPITPESARWPNATTAMPGALDGLVLESHDD